MLVTWFFVALLMTHSPAEEKVYTFNSFAACTQMSQVFRANPGLVRPLTQCHTFTLTAEAD